MNKKLFIVLLAISALLIALVSVAGRDQKTSAETDPAFGGYISAFTSGMVSAATDIRIVLANDYAQANPGQEADKKLLSFSPSIKGKAVWIDSRTISFQPDEYLESGTTYQGTFKLGKIAEVEGDLKEFDFNFRVIPQTISVQTEQLGFYNNQDLTSYFFSGVLQTADVAVATNTESSLLATQNGRELPIRWIHESDGMTHRFVIDSIRRADQPGYVNLEWNGNPLHAEGDGKLDVRIPSLSEFMFLSARVVQAPEQYIIATFSDPLLASQQVEGLIELDPSENITFSIEGNQVHIYPGSRISGERKLIIRKEVKNVLGYPLMASVNQSVTFEEIKPSVRLSSTGVIVPSGGQILFPFEAVSLEAVDVTVFRIFENNIPQFLQVNQLNGNSELRRVGRKVLQKIVPLSGSRLDHAQWNTYHLDLSDLIKTEPGAIYKVTLGYKREYSSYFCEGESGPVRTFTLQDNWKDEDEDNPYDYYYEEEYDYYYDDEEYDWSQRDNPCHSMYYRYGRTVSRNVLSSDLGLIAKQGETGEILIAATNLLTTAAEAGVEFEIYNYQNQVIGKGSTDGDGFATVKVNSRPFLLVAKKGSQRGYLRLDEGSALSLSAFDVTGDKVQKGIKGFIYAERGVWRPGDSIHTSFILEDGLSSIPAGHPITFELVNPLGQLVHSATQAVSDQKIFYFPVKTEQQDPTGNYTAHVKIGGNRFSKTLKVETIMPNRLKLNLDYGREKLTASNLNPGKLQVRWLHGAVARNLKVRVDLTLTRSATSFNKWKDYSFDDAGRSFPAEDQVLMEGRLDEQGIVEVPSVIKPGSEAPGVLNANFTVRAFEEGGAASIDRFTLPYYPYETFVGIKAPEGQDKTGTLETDTTYYFSIVSVDAEGRPVGGRRLKAEVYKLDWRWWWDRNGEDLSNYVSRYYQRQIGSSSLVTGSDGKGSWKIRVPRSEWGRYMIRMVDEESGHAASMVKYFDWPAWDRKNRGDAEGAAMLMFSSNKENYNVGEDVLLTIPTPEAGKALITVESGKGIVHRTWLETQKGETTWAFKTEAGMAPNLYVSVILIQPHSQTANDLPMRMYGVLPIFIEDPQTRLLPQIASAEVFRPEETASIKVSEANGREMSYTLAIVDDGLLDLTRFKTPDPWAVFYAREALGIRTWDLYDLVLGASSGALKRILAIGGDESGKVSGTPKANRFKPMVIFSGPHKLKKSSTNTHEIKIPRYVGSARIMVVAAQEKAYGNAEKTVAIRKPLMLLATLPRVLGTSEKVSLPVNVFAMEKDVKDVSITLETLSGFTVTGDKSATVQFSQTGDQLVFFDLTSAASNKLGKVRITARSGRHTATEEIEIDIRNPNEPSFKVYDALVKAGSTSEIEFEPHGISGSNKAWIEISSMPAMNLEKRLKYLIRYPHGCVEQTISGAFPQLYLSNLTELSEQDKALAETNIKAAIEAMKRFQLPAGGFSYWPGSNDVSEWGTSYAGHFLLEAEKQGYAIPSGMLSKWKQFQRGRSSAWVPYARNRYGYTFRNDELMQAYRLYTLAVAGSAETGAMNRLREKKDMSVQAKWRLAAAYAIAGQKAAAVEMVKGIPTTVPDYRELGYTYGSQLRDRAMILETVSILGMESQKLALVREVAEEVGSSGWLSTQELAYSLYAVSKVAGELKPAPINANVVINGKTVKMQTQRRMIKDHIVIRTGTNTISVSGPSQGVLFARVIVEGIPPQVELPPVSDNLRLSVSYVDLNGNSVRPEELGQGTDFIAEVTVTHPGIRKAYEQMALVIPVSAGWEIHNQRMADFESEIASSVPEYMDIRDDRVNYYFDLDPAKSKVFRFKITASYTGEFYHPAITCYAMYDESIFARQGGRWVKVVRQIPAL